MDKNTMIANLEEQASQLLAVFELLLKGYDKTFDGSDKLIALSQELRALYHQIYEMKYCYVISPGQEDA